MRFLLRYVILLGFALSSFTARADLPNLPQPTPEELSMTSQPQVPGANAVLLYHGEYVEDFPDETYTVVNSIKILNADGRDKFSTISIEHSASRGNFFSYQPGMKIDNIVARTIQADGTIVPFTGKPFDRLAKRSKDESTAETVIGLPDVRVGSIVQYRYTIHDMFRLPTWYIEHELFVRKEHFYWHTHLKGIAYTAAIPGGPAGVHASKSGETYEADLENIVPEPNEPFMPPMQSFEPRVVFYQFYSDKIRTTDAYWTETSKNWNQAFNEFLGKPSSLSKAAGDMTEGATTQDEKLRKIYAFVMGMENTRFTRSHTAAEDKAAGLKDINKPGDILKNKRGSDDQLTALFVALARASGFKAYLMTVTARDRGIFYKSWLSYSQFNDLIAIVEVDGKERYFDPGQQFCPYGQLQWTHTGVMGLRQKDKEAEFGTTPNGDYRDSQTKRIADLVLDKTGRESGDISLSYTGARALAIRQKALQEDSQGLHKEFEDGLKDSLPDGSDVQFSSIEGLDDYEKPITVHFAVKGPLAITMTNKRMIVPGQLFQTKEKMVFPEEKRETPVYFHFPETVLDAVRLKLPEGWDVESQPSAGEFKTPIGALYSSRLERDGKSITLRRSYAEGTIIVLPEEYPELRTFYSKLAARDQEPLVLHSSAAVAH